MWRPESTSLRFSRALTIRWPIAIARIENTTKITIVNPILKLNAVFDHHFLVRQENSLPKRNVPPAASQGGAEILIRGV